MTIRLLWWTLVAIYGTLGVVVGLIFLPANLALGLFCISLGLLGAVAGVLSVKDWIVGK